jgi:hypothetical protein
MSPADEVLLWVLEWLEPENVTRFMEISEERNRPMSELAFVALRNSLERRGATPEEIAEAKALFRQCGIDWDRL